MIIAECEAGAVTRLPAELLEQILGYVEDEDVINAAHASLQWNNVCQRVARRRCADKIPQVCSVAI